MSFQAAKCPACGGDLQLPSDKDHVKCMYCSADIVVRDAVQAVAAVKIENLHKLASTAESAGNHQEAFRYYSAILEQDPTCVDAWIGKGKAAAWQSTLSLSRHDEMITAFKQAMLLASADQKSNVDLACAEAITSFVAAYYDMAFKHLREFVTVESTGGEFAQQCIEMIYCLEIGLALVPDHQPLLRLLITIYDRLSVGVYGEPPDWKIARFHLPESTKKEFTATLQSLISKMKQLDPSYQPPQRPKKSGCYIATATMGNYDHPTVCELRSFRDDVLMASVGGTTLVRAYYYFSPRFATLIEGSVVLQSLSYFFVVLPSLLISRMLRRAVVGN